MAKKHKKKEIDKQYVNSMKSCQYCKGKKCKSSKTRTTLQNFKDVTFCTKTHNVISYTKETEA